MKVRMNARHLYIFILLSLWSRLTFGQVDINTCKIDTAKIGKCPNSSVLAPGSMPSQVIFFNGFARMPAELRIEIVEAAARSHGYIGVGKYDIESLERNCTGACLQRLDKVRNQLLRIDDKVLFPVGSNGIYVRDETIYRTQDDSLALKIFQNSSRLNSGPKSVCGIKTSFEDGAMVTGEADGVNLAGNVLSLPGGVCAIGEGMSLAVQDQACGKKAKRLTLKTSGLDLRHIDMLFGVVPNPQDKQCPFRIPMANAQMTIEILKKDPTGKFFDKKQMGDFIKGAINGPTRANEFWDVCRYVDDLLLLRQLQDVLVPGHPDRQTGKPQSTTSIHPISNNRSPAGLADPEKEEAQDEYYKKDRAQFPELYEAYEEIEAKQKNRPSFRDCENVTNAQIVELLEAQKSFGRLDGYLEAAKAKIIPPDKTVFTPYDDPSIVSRISNQLNGLIWFGKNNETFDTMQEDNWHKIRDSLPPQCRSEKLRIPVPQLMYSGSAINPNPGNSMVVGDLVVYPKQPNAALAQAVESAFKSANLKPVPHDTFNIHAGNGNIHCSTNEIRLCNP